MIVNPVKFSGTTSSGAYSSSLPYIEGILRQVRCKFTTASTTFILTINDSDGIPIYNSEPATGELVEQVALAVRGIYTVVISGASKDEEFQGRLEVQE
jgi:hypothetical protein